VPEPRVTRLPTPPGSIVVVHITHELLPEDVLPFAAALQHQTGLPVVLVDQGATVSVSEADQAAAALRDAVEAVAGPRVRPGELAAELLARVAVDGWELIRLRQP
jgi:hypothetical protein